MENARTDMGPKPGFIPEAWSLYGVGVVCILVRLAGKTRRVGLRHLQLDDAFIALGLIWFTLLCVSLNEIARGPGSNFMTREEAASLTPELTAARIRGSKWVFASEHAMLLTIWSMKAAMLVLYARITDQLRQRRLLFGLIAWVICAFLGDELSLFLICSPLSQYWAIHPENAQCAIYRYYQIVNAVFNISTDILILIFGVPPVLKARLSRQQKFILGFIFGMGVFVVAAAIARAIYCIVPSLMSYVYMYWYFREASVAVYVATLPGIWVFLREVFPILQRLTSPHCSRKTEPHTDLNIPPARKPCKNRDPFATKALDCNLDTCLTDRSTMARLDLESGQGVTGDALAPNAPSHGEKSPELEDMSEVKR